MTINVIKVYNEVNSYISVVFPNENYYIRNVGYRFDLGGCYSFNIHDKNGSIDNHFSIFYDGNIKGSDYEERIKNKNNTLKRLVENAELELKKILDLELKLHYNSVVILPLHYEYSSNKLYLNMEYEKPLPFDAKVIIDLKDKKLPDSEVTESIIGKLSGYNFLEIIIE